MPGALEGRVALVAGATRGAGRGIAVALGEAGATVYCTGRSTRQHRSEYDRPETIEETAEQVTAAGGQASRSPAATSAAARGPRLSGGFAAGQAGPAARVTAGWGANPSTEG